MLTHQPQSATISPLPPSSSSSPSTPPVDALHALVATLVAKSDDSSHSRAFSYSARILASRLQPSILDDENALLHAVNKHLVKQSPRAALNFQNLHTKLAKSSSLHNRWAVVYLLYSLAQSPSLSSANTSMVDNDSALGFSILDSSSSATAAGLKDISDVTYSTPSLSSASPFSLDKPFLNTTPLARHEQTQHKKQAQASSQYRAPEPRNKNLDKTSPETLLLRDLIYAYQGIDGKYVKWNESVDGWEFVDLSLSEPMKTLLTTLTEPGYYYKKLSILMNQTHSGLVNQSFWSAIRTEIAEWFRLIAVLEGQMTVDGGQLMTLKKLSVWMKEPGMRLKMMFVVGEMCGVQQCGPLLTHLHTYTTHGDPTVRKFTLSLLRTTSAPFFRILQKWLSSGEFDDPYSEFFIGQDESVGIDGLWRDRFRVVAENVPGFMSRASVKRVLGIGKSLDFLRRACGILERGLNDQLLSYESVLSGEFERVLEGVYARVSRVLWDVYMGKFGLMNHFQAVRKYLLLGLGDFVGSLMEGVGPMLNNPAGSLYRHNLTGILETAIRSSLAQHDSPEILKRLDVRILEASPGDNGWDVFTLDYHVDSPISTVFTPAAMTSYLRLSNFLWRVRRVNWVLNGVWGTVRKCCVHELEDLKNELQMIHSILHEMIHFIQQLQYYLLFEVLECSWSELTSFLESKTGDLDQLIGAHNKFLNNVIGRGLLNSVNKKLLSGLLKIFESIIGFSSSVERVCVLGEEKVLRDAGKDYARDLESAWGVRIESVEDLGLGFEDKMAKLRSKMALSAQDFKSEFGTFLKDLSNHSDVNLRLLGFRLDFNEYYSLQMQRA